MKKSGVLFKALVISGLMVINGPSAVLCDGRQSSEACRDIIFYQVSKEKSSNSAIDCIPGTWTGATGYNWNTPTNWCDGNVPTSITNVTIPSGVTQPVIDSEAYCNHLTIQPSANLTIQGYNKLSISGNLINNGSFTCNKSTVIFNGYAQEVGKGPYHNLTLKGNGLKTIHNVAGVDTYVGILSMEDQATVSETPSYDIDSRIQYNSSSPKTVGLEWPPLYTAGGIIIKNTGTIKLNAEKLLTNSSGGGSLTVEEGATLDLDIHAIREPESLNLKCGGRIKSSCIIGTTGILYLRSTLINITDAGNGTAGALITCLINLTGSNTFTIANDATNIFTDDDLTLSMLSTGGSIYKYGQGTLNLGESVMQLENLKVNQGYVTIPVGAKISVNTGTIITPPKGLCIESNALGSGSFITNNLSGDGSASVIRYMSPRRWHIVSSPVSGQSIGQFLTANGNIPKNTASGAPTAAPFERGMRGYDPLNNQWGNFYMEGSTESMTMGKGYLVRVKSTGDQNVTFTGTLNSGDISVTGLASGLWNCIGNPYASAIRINSSFETQNLLGVNSTNLDPLYGAIYIWHQAEAESTASGVYNETSGSYQTISNASFAFGDNPSTEHEIQLGQAFMVKMATGKTLINFKRIMQVHYPGLALKSTGNVWPTIQLKATADSMTSSTIIAFHERMTPGLDPTFDAGQLKAGDEMSLYTVLVEDAGIPFAIQALPDDYESTVVPLGIDGTKGKEVIFSAELFHFPSTCRAILEDRLTATLTDLSMGSYTADLRGSLSSQGRFFLHTSYSTTDIDSHHRIQNLRAWAVSNREMRISGKVGSKAKAMVFDIQGRLILSEPLKAGIDHTVRLPEIKSGIYILHIEEKERKHVLKIFVRK